jgi:hypothetical protein
MKRTKEFLIVMTVVLGLVLASVGVVHAIGDSESDGEVVASCYPGLPSPQLVLQGIELRSNGNIYWLAITNWSSFPDELFEPAPHLPPCGQNTNASRTWLRIYDGDDKYVYGFCAFSSASDLGQFGFFVPTGNSPPSSVYITLDDRECSILYTSNSVPILIAVAIDIKPGSYPNSLNLKSRGVVPVAVLTTADFDAIAVDPDTVVFAGASPLRWAKEDVDGDGDTDLVFHFDMRELDLDPYSVEAALTGETLDGIPIEGTDAVTIVP